MAIMDRYRSGERTHLNTSREMKPVTGMATLATAITMLVANTAQDTRATVNLEGTTEPQPLAC